MVICWFRFAGWIKFQLHGLTRALTNVNYVQPTRARISKRPPILPKIALEEHSAIEETLGDSRQFTPEDQWSERRARPLDFLRRAPGLYGQALHREDDRVAQCAGHLGD